MNPEDLDHRDYLGDGLYVGTAGYQVVLYSSNGVAVLDMVYLNESVLESFEHWVKRLREEE